MTQHYLFAHRMLASLALSDPGRARSLLQEPGFLERLWVHAGEHATEGAVTSAPQGLGLETVLLAAGTVTLFHLPEPDQSPEAYFVAVLWGPERPRVFTLEKGSDLETGGSCTYLCGWLPRTHENYGQGPKPERAAFLEALERHLSTRAGA